MPANSNNPSPPITIPTIPPVLKLEEVEVEVPLLEGEDAVFEGLGELPLYVAVRAGLCMLLKKVVSYADAEVVRVVGTGDGTDPPVFVGDEPPAT